MDATVATEPRRALSPVDAVPAEPVCRDPSSDLHSESERQHLALSALIAFALLFAVTFALDLDGSLGSDSGGKVATINAMVESGGWSVDIGYWAEGLDPEGLNYPFFGTRANENGWINVTSLPMILVTKPLVDLAGPRARFIVPILGTILSGLAAGSISRRFGARSGVQAFWVTTIASSCTVYALDFWEHSFGVALVVGAQVLIIDIIRRRDSLPMMLLVGCGLLFGSAAVLRQEALVYGFVSGLAVLTADVRSQKRLNFARGAVLGLAALVPLALNVALEQAFYGESVRNQRSVGTIATAGDYGLGERVRDGIFVLVSPINEIAMSSIVLGLAVVMATVWLASAVLRDGDIRKPSVAVAMTAVPFAARSLVLGPEYVPGLLVATPIAILGIVAAVRYGDRLILWLALAPIPLVWLVQYQGATVAQWGARYLLPSGVLLLAYAMGRLRVSAPALLRGFVLANFVVSGLGVWMLIGRTHDFGSAHRELGAIEGVVVFSDPFIAREAAPVGWNERWLSAGNNDQRASASRILMAVGETSFEFISFSTGGTPEFPGFVPTEEKPLYYGSFALSRTRYESTLPIADG